MNKGNIVHEWDHLKLPSSMPLSLQDLVSKCLDLDSRNRHVTVEELVNHSFIKTPIRGSIKERANDNDEENSDFQSSPLPSLALTTSAVSGSFPSRLLCEFETMQFLGLFVTQIKKKLLEFCVNVFSFLCLCHLKAPVVSVMCLKCATILMVIFTLSSESCWIAKAAS